MARGKTGEFTPKTFICHNGIPLFSRFQQRNSVCGLLARPLKNADFYSSSRKANILTTGIHRVFRGLKFEPDAEIGEKKGFCKGLNEIKG